MLSTAFSPISVQPSWHHRHRARPRLRSQRPSQEQRPAHGGDPPAHVRDVSRPMRSTLRTRGAASSALPAPPPWRHFPPYRWYNPVRSRSVSDSMIPRSIGSEPMILSGTRWATRASACAASQRIRVALWNSSASSPSLWGATKDGFCSATLVITSAQSPTSFGFFNIWRPC